jgi:Domain of unknown function (DUF932)
MNNQDAVTVIEQTQGFEMSQKYKPIRTKDVVDSLVADGYVVNQVSKSKVRKKTKDGFQKHLLRISRNDLDLGIDGLRPEIILINSYDGSSSFQLLVGVFRFACANGLIVGNSYFQRRIKHIGDVLPKVLNAVNDVKHALPMVAEDIKKFGTRVLSQDEKQKFALKVAQSVTGLPEVQLVNPESLLEVKRDADKGNDLFTVLNVVQENILQGNLKVLHNNGLTPTIRKMRKVKSITRSTEINQLVWDNATELMAA